jgi:hypothetical protein
MEDVSFLGDVSTELDTAKKQLRSAEQAEVRPLEAQPARLFSSCMVNNPVSLPRCSSSPRITDTLFSGS